MVMCAPEFPALGRNFFEDTPRTDPHERHYRMGLLSWMNSVKANSWVRMQHPRLRQPAVHQPHYSRPVQVMLLAATAQNLPPKPSHSIAKDAEAFRVSRYRVVVEVALYDRSQPPPGERRRLMHASAELLFDFFQLGPQPLANRFAL